MESKGSSNSIKWWQSHTFTQKRNVKNKNDNIIQAAEMNFSTDVT